MFSLPHGSGASNLWTSDCRHHRTSINLNISSNFSLKLPFGFIIMSVTIEKKKGNKLSKKNKKNNNKRNNLFFLITKLNNNLNISSKTNTYKNTYKKVPFWKPLRISTDLELHKSNDPVLSLKVLVTHPLNENYVIYSFLNVCLSKIDTK